MKDKQLADYITRIVETTGESGADAGNTLRDIFNRMTEESTYEILNEVGIDTAKPSGEVIKELSVKWESITKEMQTKIGLALAGRYNLARFMAIMKVAN